MRKDPSPSLTPVFRYSRSRVLLFVISSREANLLQIPTASLSRVEGFLSRLYVVPASILVVVSELAMLLKGKKRKTSVK